MDSGKLSLAVLGYAATLRWSDPRWSPQVEERLELLRLTDAPPAGAPEFSFVTADHADTDFPFSLLKAGEQLITAADRETVVDYLIWYIQGEATRANSDYVIVHAGCIVSPLGGAVLLPGASGSGKSTLTIALLARGWRLLSDEYALIAQDGTVSSFPRRLAVKPGSYDVVAAMTGSLPPPQAVQQWHLRPEDLGSSFADGDHAVVAVVAPVYRPGAPLTVEALSASSVVELLAMNQVNRGAHRDGGLRAMAQVARAATGAGLTYADLDEATAWLTALVSGADTRSRTPS